MVTSDKGTAQKSTETAKRVRQIIKEQSKKAHEVAAAGGPIAYIFISSFYDEILRAMDITTVGTENYAAVCTAKHDVDRFIDRAAADGYARYLCSYATCGLGFDSLRHELGNAPPNSPDGGMPKPTMMLGTGQMICDPRYKWYQAEQRYTGAAVHITNMLVPQAYYSHVDLSEIRDYYIRYVVQELKDLVEFVEHETGQKMNWDRLSEAVNLSERTARLWFDAYQLRKAIPAPMPTQDALNAMVPGCYLMGMQVAHDYYQALYDEIKYRVDNKIGTIPNEKYRLLWADSIPPWYALDMFNYFQSLGAVFAMEGTYPPQRPVDIPPSVTDPLERIAWRFYEFWTWNHNKANANTRNRQAEKFLEVLEEFKCDAVVFHQALTCRTVHAGQLNQINLLKKYSDKPVLILEGDMSDASAYNAGATRTKIDAFIEVVDAYKKRANAV